MSALRVVAHLAQGYVSSDPWSPALDGILAYWRLRELLGEEEFALGATGHRELVICEDLPLEREEWCGRWWWRCSSPIVTADARRFERHYHRRFDDAQASRFLPEGTRRIETAAGPYKQYRHRAEVALAPCLEWHVLGEREGVERLLRRCVFIGSGISRGYGEVRRWEIAEDGDPWLARFWRPLPAGFAAGHGISGLERDWGIVPPGRLPQHRMRCVMPLPRPA